MTILVEQEEVINNNMAATINAYDVFNTARDLAAEAAQKRGIEVFIPMKKQKNHIDYIFSNEEFTKEATVQVYGRGTDKKFHNGEGYIDLGSIKPTVPDFSIIVDDVFDTPQYYILSRYDMQKEENNLWNNEYKNKTWYHISDSKLQKYKDNWESLLTRLK